MTVYLSRFKVFAVYNLDPAQRQVNINLSFVTRLSTSSQQLGGFVQRMINRLFKILR